MAPKKHKSKKVNEVDAESDAPKQTYHFSDPLAPNRSYVEKLRPPEPETQETDPSELAQRSHDSFVAALQFGKGNQTGPAK